VQTYYRNIARRHFTTLLYNRFINEEKDALAMLKKELGGV